MGNADLSSEVKERIEIIRAARGFILPHHGLMAVCDMPLLKAYDTFYRELALNRRSLSDHDKELVWVMCLITVEEPVPVHHIRNLRAAGGTDAEIAELAKLAAVLRGAAAFEFVGDHFRAHMPVFDRREMYLSTYRPVAEKSLIGQRMSALVVLNACVCRGLWKEFEWHMEEAYLIGVPEREIAEAISIAMFPVSAANYFYRACKAWRQLIRDKKVQASPEFQVWADLPDNDPTAG